MRTRDRLIWTVLGVWMALKPFQGPPGLFAQVSDPPTVRGWVVEYETGEGLVGASVSLASENDSVSASGRVLSGVQGFFGFQEVPPGLYRITASLLGYHEVTDTVRVVDDADVEITLRLSVEPVALDPVVVTVRRRPVGPLEGFERRRVSQRGLFLDRGEIEATNAQEFTDIVRGVPGARLVPTATGNRLYFRGGCVPDLWLDGAQLGSTADIDSYLRVEDLEAVEVYRGPETPGEFGNNLCGTVVAWTMRGHAPGDEDNDRSLKTQLIFAGTFVLSVLGFRWLIG